MNTNNGSTVYGFQALSEGQWTAAAAGEQNPSNYLPTREAAEAQLPALAAALECDVTELRVVAIA